MKMCRWACGHILREHVRKYNIRERETGGRGQHRGVRESETDVRDDNTSEERLQMLQPGRRRRRGRPKQRWMDYVHRDMRAIGTTKDEVHDRTG